MNGHSVVKAALEIGDLAAKSFVVLAAAWFATLVMRRNSAAIRHLVWLSAFCVLLVLPVLTLLTPSQPIAIIRDPLAKRVVAAMPTATSTTIAIGQIDLKAEAAPAAT